MGLHENTLFNKALDTKGNSWLQICNPNDVLFKLQITENLSDLI